jgi:uncharacterized membrane protein
MIETLRSLVTDSPFPSLHVMVIHFPIALLFIAPLFDIGCIVFRKRVWLDRAAATLYVMGTIGAGAAYLTGQRAAAALQDLSPATESALADHENLATLTLITLSVVCLVRLTVSWLARDDRHINLGIFRLVAIPVVLAGLVMLALTADRGGKLVYRYGVGVTPGIVETLER